VVEVCVVCVRILTLDTPSCTPCCQRRSGCTHTHCHAPTLPAVEPAVAPQLVNLLPNMANLLARGRDNTAAFQILEAYLLLQVSFSRLRLGLEP
jgi:hypothetical protein